MPGRQFGQGENYPGVLVNGTTMVNGYSLPVDLILSSRATGDAAEYVASGSVEFGSEFESGATDEFTAYIADNSYAGTGNQVSGGGEYGTGGRYRYGFNGKENDNEVKGTGNQQDYGMRIHDPRLGRFLSVDPITKDFPELSPYQFGSNRPIDGIDRDGLEWQEIVFREIFIEPFKRFQRGADKYGEGTRQKVDAQTGQADYQNTKVPVQVQRELARRDIGNGTAKQIEGGTEMAIATTEVVSTYAPLGAEGILAIKSPSTMAITGRWVYKGPVEAPKPYGFQSLGSEFLEDGLRMIEQPNQAVKTGLQLEKSVADVMGKGYTTSGEVTVPIKNTELLNKLNATSKGDWVKVYEAGIQKGNKVETHYFRNNATGQVFDVKPKYNYWHQKAFKNLSQ